MRITISLLISLLSFGGTPLSQAQDLNLNITQNGSNLDFQWSSQAGKFYRFWSSSDLSAASFERSLVAEDLAGVGSVGTFSIPRSSDSLRFYWMEEYTVPLLPVPLLQLEMVTVGNPGNLTNPLTNFGAVNYEYQIAKYELTNQQYVIFLNAVDPLGFDDLNLFHREMETNPDNGGITFTLENFDGNKYEVKEGFESKPVSYISIFDAMRFCNWLHNGAQTNGDTENGAYTLIDTEQDTPANGRSVQRNANAKFTVPTADEWHKAAFYQPFNDGGDVGNYWLYSAGGNQLPNAVAPPGVAPAANYNRALTGFTAVGAYTDTIGYYGTYDMAGNASEWTETISSTASLVRLKYGSSWISSSNTLASTAFSGSFPGGLHLDGLRISAH